MPDASAPLVSVVVTAYNSGEPLLAALRSADAQTWPQKEIIVVDDGSKPEHAEIIEKAVAAVPGVRLLRQHNRGLSGARNAGAATGRGEYVAFLDHDDLWKPELLEKLVRAFERGSGRLGCVFCRIEHMREDGELTGRTSRPKMRGFTVADLLVEDPACCGSSFLVRMDAFMETGGFAEDFKTGETPEFFVRLRLAGWELEGIDDVLVYYRNTMGGISGKKSAQHLRDRLRTVDKAVAQCPQLGKGRWIKFKLRVNDWKNRVRKRVIG